MTEARQTFGAETLHCAAPADEPSGAVAPSPSPGRCVLVVEDDEATREALMMGLEHAGWVVVGAADGRAALDLLRGGLAPRVIVLDLMMPVMDGREFRRRLLEDEALASIPLVVVSADMWASRLAGAPGVHAVLMKPVDLDDVLRSLEGSCKR